MLKVDRSFVRSVGQLDARREDAIIRAMVQLSADLGLSLVAEGVEGETQLKLLYDLGVRVMQGYYFAPPAVNWMPDDLLPL